MADFSNLRSFYWHIRYTRCKVVKRRYYRYVLKEKKRLIQSGVDKEYLRLYCRTLAFKNNEHAERRLLFYKEQNCITN